MKVCAYCNKELKESYSMFMDNFLQLKYFDELDGSDNVFCDSVCACNALMLEEFEIENEEENENERI